MWQTRELAGDPNGQGAASWQAPLTRQAAAMRAVQTTSGGSPVRPRPLTVPA
jgi:hypothetical protein